MTSIQVHYWRDIHWESTINITTIRFQKDHAYISTGDLRLKSSSQDQEVFCRLSLKGYPSKGRQLWRKYLIQIYPFFAKTWTHTKSGVALKFGESFHEHTPNFLNEIHLLFLQDKTKSHKKSCLTYKIFSFEEGESARWTLGLLIAIWIIKMKN